MDLLLKIGKILIILGLIYLWNKYIVKTLIHKVIGFHKRNNTERINKQPIKFLIDNEFKIIKFAQYFYWFGAIIISFQILFN
jgi:hypothetical protein